MPSLNDLTASTPEDNAPAQEMVDISSFYGKEEGTVVLTWSEPTMAQIFSAGEKVEDKKIWRAFPVWPKSLKQMVGLLCAAHVAPLENGDNPLMFYGGIAMKNKALWVHLVRQLRERFPDMAGFSREDEEEEGND